MTVDASTYKLHKKLRLSLRLIRTNKKEKKKSPRSQIAKIHGDARQKHNGTMAITLS